MQDFNLVIVFVCFVLAYIVLSLCLRKFGDLSIKFNSHKTTLVADGIEVFVSCTFNLKHIPLLYVPVFMFGKSTIRDLLGDKIELAIHNISLHNNNSFMFNKRDAFTEKIAHILSSDNGISKWFHVEDVQVVEIFNIKDTSGPTEEEKKAAEERAERFHEDLKRMIDLKMQIEAAEVEKQKKLKNALVQAEFEKAKAVNGVQKIDAAQMAHEKMIEIVKEESSDKALEETAKMAFDSIAKHIKDKEQS